LRLLCCLYPISRITDSLLKILIAYLIIGQLAGEISKAKKRKSLEGVLLSKDTSSVRIEMGDYILTVAHEFTLGYSGGTTSTTLANTLPILLTQPFGKPDLCHVLLGTNDTTNGVPIPTIISNLNQIYSALAAAGIQPIAATIPPGGAAQAIELLNYAILRNARAQGIPCVDYYSALVNYATGNYIAAYTNDNIHPNSTGASIMGYVLNLALQGFFGSGNVATPTLVDLSGAATQNRHPAFDALAAGSINTGGSYPTGWPAPNAAITTMFARNCASFTVRPYESQLFHPSGGVGASALSSAPIRKTESDKIAAA